MKKKQNTERNLTPRELLRFDAPHGPLLVFGSGAGLIENWGKCVRISVMGSAAPLDDNASATASVQKCVDWLTRLIKTSQIISDGETTDVRRALAFVQGSDDDGFYCTALLDVPKAYPPRSATRLLELAPPYFPYTACVSFCDPLEVAFAIGSLKLVPAFNGVLF
jgi:hypothetical protein